MYQGGIVDMKNTKKATRFMILFLAVILSLTLSPAMCSAGEDDGDPDPTEEPKTRIVFLEWTLDGKPINNNDELEWTGAEMALQVAAKDEYGNDVSDIIQITEANNHTEIKEPNTYQFTASPKDDLYIFEKVENVFTFTITKKKAFVVWAMSREPVAGNTYTIPYDGINRQNNVTYTVSYTATGEAGVPGHMNLTFSSDPDPTKKPILDAGTYIYTLALPESARDHFVLVKNENGSPSAIEIESDSLTVIIKPAPLTVTTGSGTKEYDGGAITNSTVSLEGLVNNENAAVTATGSQTEVGSSPNTYAIDWGDTKSTNYTLTENLGSLEVTKISSEVTLTAPSDSKIYDGKPLICDGTGEKKFTVAGLPEGYTAEATVTGSQTNAGSSANALDGVIIRNASGEDKTDCFANIVLVDGLLTVDRAKASITVDSASKVQGENDPVFTGKVEGLIADGDLGTVEYIRKGNDSEPGTYTGVLTAQFTENANYDVTIHNGSFTIEPKKAVLTFDLAGGTLDGKTGTVSLEAEVGKTITLPAAPTKAGYTFQYWKGSEYKAGAEYTVDGDHTFTAVWADKNKVEGAKTGDSSPVVIWTVLLAAAAVCLLAVLLIRKRYIN